MQSYSKERIDKETVGRLQLLSRQRSTVFSLELKNWGVLIESVLQGRFFHVLRLIQLCCRTLRAHGKEWVKLLDLGKRQSSFFVVLLNANTRQTHKIDCFVGPTGPPHFSTSSAAISESLNDVAEVLLIKTNCKKIRWV